VKTDDTSDEIFRELMIAIGGLKARHRWQRSATKQERTRLANEEARNLAPLLEALGDELSPTELAKFPPIRRAMKLVQEYRGRELKRLLDELRRRKAKRRWPKSKT
jgi:hypothetical protein